MTDLQQLIVRTSQPLVPRPTGEHARLQKLPGIRVVLFDVYGTLLISGSGDIGAAAEEPRVEAMAETLKAAGLSHIAAAPVVTRFRRLIENAHTEDRANGVDFPEVDIVDIWMQLVAELKPDAVQDRAFYEVLALRFELATNPTWPMPQMVETIREIRSRGIGLGIISNAQFFTPELFRAFVSGSPNDLGFDSGLQYYSYRVRRAKPGTFLYEQAAATLVKRGIRAEEVLYVGNDMLNDIWPAARVGFRTALFAGDARSLRLRKTDPRVAGTTPDVVLIDLLSIVDCL